MSEAVKEQIFAVRDTALTNMFDIPAVQKIASNMGYFELVIFLEENRKTYVQFILTGESEYTLQSIADSILHQEYN